MSGTDRSSWAQVVSRGLPVRKPQDSAQQAASPLGSAALPRHAGIHSLIAQYLTVTELLRIRRVSHLWRQLFSQPYCWVGSSFETSNDQLRNKHLRVDTMPFLQQMALHYTERDPMGIEEEDENQYDGFVRPYLQQLSACEGLALKKLFTQGTVTKALLRAMPHLTDLHVQGRMEVSAIASLNPKLRRLGATTLNEQHIAALARHPLLQLQHCGMVKATLSGLRQLPRACPNLTSLTLVCQCSDRQVTALATVLASLQHLTKLRLSSAPLAVELLEALHRLPRLSNLSLWGKPYQKIIPSIEFLQAISALQQRLSSNLSDEQQDTQLRIVGCKGNSGCSDEWWYQALVASDHCTELNIKVGEASEVAWQRYMSKPHSRSTSMLRQLDGYDFAHLDNFPLNRYLHYVKSHVNLTELDAMPFRDAADELLSEALSCLPKLRDLTLCEYDPSLVHRALAKSGALLTLERLSVHNGLQNTDAMHLKQTLQMIKQATSLRDVWMSAPYDAWSAISPTELKASVQHVTELHITVEEVKYTPASTRPRRLTAAQQRDRTSAVAKLLLLPSLTELDLTAHAQMLTHQQMADMRWTRGLNRVYIDYRHGYWDAGTCDVDDNDTLLDDRDS